MKKVAIHLTQSIYYRKGQARAQVIVLTGEGSNRRSVNRHVGMQDGIWIGNNPDDTAVDRNAFAEQAVQTAEQNVRATAIRLDELNQALVKKDDLTKEELATLMLLGVDQKELKTVIQKMIREIEFRLVEASQQVIVEATKNMDKVREEFPLVVQFVGADLSS